MLCTQLVALALAATTLAASGCGGSSKTESKATAAATTAPATTATTATTTTATTPLPTTTTVKLATGTPLKRAEWIAKGDAICARTNVKLNSSILRTTQDYVRILPQAAGYDRVEATELGKLVPPAGLASDWRQVVVGFQKFGEYTTQVAAEYAQTSKPKAVASILLAAKTTHERLAAIAKRDGFKVCSVV